MRAARRIWGHRPGGLLGSAGAAGVALAFCAVLFMAAALVSGCGSGASGETAPDFAGTTLDGKEVSLSEYRGKPLVLAFMASW